jgi:hypothetical protein
LAQVCQSHSRIDYHRNGADLEKSKRQSEKLQAGLNHQDGSDSWPDANHLQTRGDPIALFVELAKSELRRVLTAQLVSALWTNHGESIRLYLGHGRQMSGDVSRGKVNHCALDSIGWALRNL